MKKRIISILMGAALSISLLAGCGSDGDESKQAVNEEGKKTTLTFIGHTSEDAKVEWEDQVIAGFEAEHEGVTIEVQRMSFDDYIQTIQTKFASGDAPDLYALPTDYLDKYIDNGYVEPVTDTKAASSFKEGMLDMLSKDGEVYAVPYVSNVMGVTYNKEVFEQAGITETPKTLEEFYQVCEKIKEAGVTPIGAAYADTWCIMADVQADYIPGVLLKNNDAIKDVESRTVKFAESDEWNGVLKRMSERMKYLQDDPFGTDWNTVCTMLSNGEVAMTLNGDWTSNNVLALKEDADLGFFALPADDNAKNTVLAVQTPTEGLAVSGTSKNKEIAKEFLDYYTSKTSVDAYLERCQEICVIEGAEMKDASGALADIMTLMDNDGAISLGAVDHNFKNQFRDALQSVLAEYLISGETDPSAYLDQLDEEFDRIAQD